MKDVNENLCLFVVEGDLISKFKEFVDSIQKPKELTAEEKVSAWFIDQRYRDEIFQYVEEDDCWTTTEEFFEYLVPNEGHGCFRNCALVYYLLKNDIEDCVPRAEKLMEKMKSYNETNKNKFFLAWIAIKKNNIITALNLFDSMATKDPKLKFIIGEFYFSKFSYGLAGTFFQECFQEKYKEKESLERLIVIFKDDEKCIDYCVRYHGLSPSFYSLHAAGFAMLKFKNYGRAVGWLEDAYNHEDIPLEKKEEVCKQLICATGNSGKYELATQYFFKLHPELC